MNAIHLLFVLVLLMAVAFFVSGIVAVGCSFLFGTSLFWSACIGGAVTHVLASILGLVAKRASES